MKVTLITHTPDPEKIVAAAARLCYSNSEIQDLFNNLTEIKVTNFLNKLNSLGHESPLEHISFTFGIEDVSRATTHQLVRHRIASYSQKSQRYVDEQNFKYVVPKKISNNPEALELFYNCMNIIRSTYCKLKQFGIETEDARAVLPNACCSSIIVTMNARTLLNFFTLRCCNRAQEEIKQVAYEMLKLCKEVAPLIFKTAGPSCVRGECSEGEMTCKK